MRGPIASDVALELPFGGGSSVSHHRFPVRRPTQSPDLTRRHFNVPRDRPAVLLSFGGYGMPSLDVSAVDCTGWTVVMTDRIQQATETRPANVVYIDERQFLGSDYRYEDLVAAADVVMSKPGYGIVSECIACDTPLLYTSRGLFREYDLFVRDMPRYLRCQFISHEALFAGRWRALLEEVLNQKPAPDSLATDGAEVAAAALEELAFVARRYRSSSGAGGAGVRRPAARRRALAVVVGGCSLVVRREEPSSASYRSSSGAGVRRRGLRMRRLEERAASRSLSRCFSTLVQRAVTSLHRFPSLNAESHRSCK
jgi:hypothetical protein